jgi:hypothetical protein
VLRLILPSERRRSLKLKLLCLGAHPDDIEIGCGGTVLRLVAEVPDLVVRWIVFTGASRRDDEARNSAAAFLEKVSEKRIASRAPTRGLLRSGQTRLPTLAHPDPCGRATRIRTTGW